ncbi:reticulophagy regulator 1 isoform X2 [Xenopus laevis]|uniref:RETREG1-3/ARL6IP-like N-terminal reticulon-homology domain-containing protein n=2 Tax=Xenopus laevis TaxID=8355 RepID=A0A974CNF4_XENLA|nr:reticulophagy regulator 1 isoform X2 [Xenopus laevis]OCT76273.1 hypothetical protein XELAEV_18031468mg [Xenopus laevis]
MHPASFYPCCLQTGDCREAEASQATVGFALEALMDPTNEAGGELHAVTLTALGGAELQTMSEAEEGSHKVSVALNFLNILTWHRPVRSLVTFLCANCLFWFLALTPWRMYHLISLILLGVVMFQILQHFLLSRSRGAHLWRKISLRWEIMTSSECKPRLGQCILESWSSYSELLHFKQRNPGKFCLLVCSVCSFFTIMGSYIPEVVLSYLLLLFAFLCPFLKCNEFGQIVCSKVKTVLQKLNFGFQAYVIQWIKARTKKEVEEDIKGDESELDLSALCPQINPATVGKELSVSDTEPSEVSWTDNGTFNLSEGYTPQTDTSDDFDRPSDQEEAFSRDLTEFLSGSGSNDDDSIISLPSMPTSQHGKRSKLNDEIYSAAALSLVHDSEETFNLISGIAGEAIIVAVSAAITDQLQSSLLSSPPPSASSAEDTEEADDFELLDQSELEDLDEGLENSPRQDPNGKKPSSGFLFSLLGAINT